MFCVLESSSGACNMYVHYAPVQAPLIVFAMSQSFTYTGGNGIK